MKTRLLTIIVCVLPVMLYAQSYEQQGDELYAQGEYAKAGKKYDAAMALDGETSSLKQKKSNASKCSSLLGKAKAAESDKNYSEASNFYSSLYSVHALPAYKSKAAAMKKKADALRQEQERLQREEQERLQREKQERLQREKEEQERLQREKQERLQREKEEQERLQREKQEQERLQRERQERERLQREKEEQERLQQKEREEALRTKNNVFSVSSKKKVRFSYGNLQYNFRTHTWRFAEHQYDRGDASRNRSSTNSGWEDLFDWRAVNRIPRTNPNNPNYYIINADWGVNPISNVIKAYEWRILTKKEWEYLYSGRKNASNLRGVGIVNNVLGYIFLPDDWSLPSGLRFMSDEEHSINTYTIRDWARMELSGAIFLPAAGYRDDSRRNRVGSEGSYWSSTYRIYPWFFYFTSKEAFMSYGEGRCLSVRLVQDL